ncbi:hypothetical protein ACYULU_09445 [Breznakiellaceae bacterium SP9]
MKNHVFLRVLVYATATILLLTTSSCLAEHALEQVLGNSAEPPLFIECKATSPTELRFEFTAPVQVKTLNFEPLQELAAIKNGTMVEVILQKPVDAGEAVLADLLVEDAQKNTLSILVPFRGRNERMPQLLINELRTEYAKPKSEFIELHTLGAGNLGGLRVFIVGTSIKETIFEFPPVEVKAGEYIVLHLRSLEDGLVDETGSNLAISGGTEALPTTRDFWFPGSKKQLWKTCGVYLMDQDGKILDAVLLSENPGTSWGKAANFAEAAALCAKQGAFLPIGKSSAVIPSECVISNGTTTTRSISRYENKRDSNTAADWYITATSGVTPGKKNSTNEYKPKPK